MAIQHTTHAAPMISRKAVLAALGSLGFGALTIGTAVAVAGGSQPAVLPVPAATAAPADASTPAGPDDAPVSAPADPAVGTPDTNVVESAAPGPDGPVAPSDEVDEPEYDGVPGLEEPGPGAGAWDPGQGVGDGDESFDPVAIDPCDATGDPQQLFVLPAVTQLASGVTEGSVEVVNCSPAPLPVEFAASNGLVFGEEATVLPVGTSTQTFTIDEDAVEVGAFELKYKLTQVGCCADYAVVRGFRQGFDPRFALDLSLTAGEGQGGCKAGCITTAWVEGNLLNTSVQLTVGTSVDADIDAFVSTQAPVPNQAGDPSMPGVQPALSSDGPDTSLTGTIGGLAEHTTYSVLIRAVDQNGVSTFVGEFTTVDPVEHPGQFAGNDPEPGCAAGCITHAKVGDVTVETAMLTVATSMPATIETWFTTAPIDTSGTSPTVSGDAAYFSTPDHWTSWKLAIDGLDGGTTYHVLVRATDENGRRDHQIGSFTTAPEPPSTVRISVDRIRMHDSGDLIGKGEVRFGYAYDGELVGTRGEQKLADDAVVHPADANVAITALEPGESIGSFAVWAGERDVAIAGFCEAPISGLACHGINWNAAYAGHLTLAEIAALPTCGTYGLEGSAAADRCEEVDSDPGIGDDPVFTALIRYHVD